MPLNEFLFPQLSSSNIDIFLVRSSILKEINNLLPILKGTLLDIGCGEMPYKELLLSEPSLVERYIGIDIENPKYQQKRRPDLFWDGINIPLDDNSIDCAVATELFEHLPDLALVLKEIKRVLKPEGILFFTIPFLWPLHDMPNDEFRYTPFSLEKIFRKTGFIEINIKAMGGWNASLAQMIGLWLRRSPISEIERKEYSEVLFPFYKYLIENDSLPSNFKESIMITGLTGTVKNKKCANSLKLNDIEIQEETDNEKKICLAIFTPQVGVVSETFITNHIKYLAPGKTVVFTRNTVNSLNFDVPVIQAPFEYNSDIFSKEVEDEIIKLFNKLKISCILFEYGCEGRGIVKLNSLKLHLPLYVHFHGADASMMLKNNAIVEYYKWMGGIVTGIITVSNKMKNRLAVAGIPKEKMIVIPYGVNIHTQRSSIPPEPPVKLITVSRLVAKKGIIFLLQAFLKAKQIAPNMILNIIGEGPLRPEIEEFISTNLLNKSVFLLGALPHETVKKMMNDSHIFIQHSITDPVTGDAEGLPNTILEASAAGLPIISTFHEGIPDAVEHEKSGFLVQEFDVDTMATYIASLSLNSSLRENMGALGREKMTNDFHLKGQIQKLQLLMGLPKGEFSTKFDEPKLDNISTEPITPFISICIPTYNRTNYIGETIQHVLNQTYTNYEIVVVDDGSTEDVEAIINGFSDERIRFIRKKHTNAADTRNLCIDESRGEFILWQNDDDYPDPELLTEYVKTLNLIPDLDVVYSYQSVHEADCNIISTPKFEDWYFNRHNLTENLLFATQFMSCVGLYKKNIYKKIGKFNTKFIRAYDYEMAFRIALNEDLKLKLVPKMLYNYRQFDKSTVSGSLKDKDCRYEWAILNKVLSLEQFKEKISEDKIGVVQLAAFYFKLAIRYSQLNCVPKTIELLEKSNALKSNANVVSLLGKTKSQLIKLTQKRKEILSFLKKDKNNPELNSYLDIIDKFIIPFKQDEFFPENDESIKGYSSSTNNNNYYSNHVDHQKLYKASDVETTHKQKDSLADLLDIVLINKGEDISDRPENVDKVKPKRLIFINHNVYPLEHSGTPISTYNHALQMKQLGFEVAVLIPSTETQSGFSKQTTENFILYKLPVINKYKVFLNMFDDITLEDYLKWTGMVIEDFKPDIVHINDYVFMPPEIISLFHEKGITLIRNVCNLEELCIFDYPVICRGSNGELCSGPENSKKCAECFLVNKLGRKENLNPAEVELFSEKIQARFDKIQFLYSNQVNGVIFTGDLFREYFKRFIKISPQITTIIPRGIKFISDRTTKPKVIKSGKIRFGFIGSLNFAKGIDVLLKAFEDISYRDDFIVEIYGVAIEKDYSDWIRKLEDNYPSKFKYCGSFEPDNLKKIAESLDIVIVPSYFDTYNRVVRELLYYGVPQIVTDFFGSSIIAHNINGIRIKVGDSKALALTMTNLIDNPEIITDLSRGVTNTKIPLLEDEINDIIKFYNISDTMKITKPNIKENDSELKTRLIAFYLPQYHPIPENDKAWGKGFTEWTNVTNAKPLFQNHYQPHLPTELGFYDLRLDDIRKEQIDLAKEYGIYGFCYYYYWFNGKQVLETPIKQLLANKNLDFPFCVCWANENWTRKWDGNEDDIICSQQHNQKDDIDFIQSLMPYFSDKRYIRTDGKLMLLIYRTELFPDIKQTAKNWREEIRNAGLGELYLVRVESFIKGIIPEDIGFDAAVEFAPDWSVIGNKMVGNIPNDLKIYDYKTMMQNMLSRNHDNYKLFRGVTPSWDNTARRGENATVFVNSSPELYEEWLKKTIYNTHQKLAEQEKFVFINAWNEWGEGNHLEPDTKYGRKYLEATKKALHNDSSENIIYNEQNSKTESSINYFLVSTPIISIIILCYNNASFTQKCLISLFKNTDYENFEIIVLDNGSSDTTPALLDSYGDKIKHIHSEENLGFVNGNNYAAKYANGDYILFLNNDTEVQPNWLSSLYTTFVIYPDAGAVGSMLLYPNGKLQEAGGAIFQDANGWNFGRNCDPTDSRFSYVREVDYCSGAALMVKSNLFKILGGFDERYAPAYYEDTDLCFGIRKLGFKVYYNPFSKVIHYEGATAGTDINSGFKKFQGINSDKFKEKWAKELLLQYPNSSDLLYHFSDRKKGKRILIIDDIPPLPDRASGAKDHYQMLMQMIDLGFKVTYVFLAGNAYSNKKAQEYLNFFRLKGVEFIWFKYEVWLNLRSTPQIKPILKQLIASLELQSRNFDLVFIAFWHVAEYFIDIIHSEIPNTPVIVDTVDIHYIREMRQAELLKDKTLMEEAKERKKRELAVYAKADCVKTVTLNDRDELQVHLRHKSIIIMPGAHDEFHSNISFENRKDFLFIGNFNHLPNGDAIDYFVKDIFPLILKELPESKLYIVGNNPTSKVKSYSSENIIVTGWVPDTRPYLERCRVSVVPLRYGGGYKGKVCETLSHGLPMVATTIAGEGIGIVNDKHAFIGDDAISFARYSVELYNNKQKWEEFSRNGQELITLQFSTYLLKKRVEYMLSFNSRESFKSYIAVKFPNPPKVSIIIAAFNQADYTKKCLESIKSFTKVSHEIILIDNASTDSTATMFQKEINYVRYFRNKSNVGFPAAINQGILRSIGEYVLILNNDTIVTAGWLERMVKVAESDTQTGIVGPISNSVSGVQLDINASYKNISELPAYAEKVRKQNADQLMEFPRVAFLCTLIKREVIEKLGGLDERFSPGNFEDDDFCLRTQLAGYKTVIAKDVFIHHYGSKSFTANGIEKYAERLRINECIFVNKWGVNPDEIWIRGKEFKKRNYRFPLNTNPAVEKYERALIKIEEKEYEQALANLDEAIENFSNGLGTNIRFDQLLDLSGNVALIINNLDAARSYFEKELKYNPTSTSSCKGLADIFFSKEEFESAKSMYEWAIKNDPDNLKAVNRLIEVNHLLGLNESHNSLSATKQVSEFDNLFLDAYNFYESGEYNMAMGKVTEAVKHFTPNKTMITKEDIYILIGNICLALNELESSQAAFETALESKPQSSEACFGLGMIFYKSSQLNEAKTMFEWAVKNNPGNERAINVLNELNVKIMGSMEIPVENEN